MRRRIVVLASAAVMAAVLVLGTVDTLVWLPQHLAPGSTLDHTYAVLAGTGDLPWAIGNAVVWLAFWAAVCALFLAVTLPVPRVLRPAAEAWRPLEVAGAGAVLLGVMVFLHWWSAFTMGMSVSDELPPYVGGTTPFGVRLFVGGAAAGVLGVVTLLFSVVGRIRRRAVADPAR